MHRGRWWELEADTGYSGSLEDLMVGGQLQASRIGHIGSSHEDRRFPGASAQRRSADDRPPGPGGGHLGPLTTRPTRTASSTAGRGGRRLQRGHDREGQPGDDCACPFLVADTRGRTAGPGWWRHQAQPVTDIHRQHQPPSLPRNRQAGQHRPAANIDPPQLSLSYRAPRATPCALVPATKRASP